MTTIIGHVRKNGDIVVLGDSATTDRMDIHYPFSVSKTRSLKMAYLDGVGILGTSGRTKLCVKLLDYFEEHSINEYLDSEELSHCSSICKISKWLDNFYTQPVVANMLPNHTARESVCSGILACKAGLFRIKGDIVTKNKLATIGSGEPYVNTSIYLGNSIYESMRIATELADTVRFPIIRCTYRGGVVRKKVIKDVASMRKICNLR